jgi:4-hydroxythreonine-4-phosphate dehydrogenase
VTATDGGIVVLADDLTGAAEVAAVFASTTQTAVAVELWPPAASHASGSSLSATQPLVRCLELNLRGLPVEDGLAPLDDALDSLAGQRRVLLKVDSHYRGAIRAYLDHLRAHESRGTIVFAAALPALGRTVRDGALNVGGLPLRESSAAHTWRNEGVGPPAVVADVVGPGWQQVGLDAVRNGGIEPLGPLIASDAETDDDLDRIVRAVWDLPRVTFVGSAGLAAAIGRKLRADSEAPSDRLADAEVPLGSPSAHAGAVLLVIGTTESGTREQLTEFDRLNDGPVSGVRASIDADPAAVAARVHSLLTASTAVALLPPAEFVPGAEDVVAEALARTTALAVAKYDKGREPESPTAIVIIGGHTAHFVLDALAVRTLTIIGDAHHGAVISRAENGRLIATRPGSFGGADSLARIVAAMRGRSREPGYPAEPHDPGDLPESSRDSNQADPKDRQRGPQ